MCLGPIPFPSWFSIVAQLYFHFKFVCLFVLILGFLASCLILSLIASFLDWSMFCFLSLVNGDGINQVETVLGKRKKAEQWTMFWKGWTEFLDEGLEYSGGLKQNAQDLSEDQHVFGDLGYARSWIKFIKSLCVALQIILTSTALQFVIAVLIFLLN